MVNFWLINYVIKVRTFWTNAVHILLTPWCQNGLSSF